LPAAYAALRAALRKTASVEDVALALLAGSAMPLVHPRVAVFLGALVIAGLVASAGDGLRLTLQRGARLVVVALGSAVLLSPWLIRLWTAHSQQMVTTLTRVPIEFPLAFATAGNDRYVLGLACVGLALEVIRGSRLPLHMAGWAGLVFLAANASSIGIPLAAWITNDSVAIALFLPASILAGCAVDRVAGLFGIDQRGPRVRWVFGLAAVGLAFSQLPSLLTVVNPCCYLARDADLRAIAWVEDHTAPSARFLVNGYRWSGNIWAGSDAGYWLPVLGHRAASMPPLFYATGPAEPRQAVDDLAAAIEEAGADPARLAELARQATAEYVFVGTAGGPIDPFALAQSPDFRVVYRDGGAWVFELAGGGGAASSKTTTASTPVDVGAPSAENAAGLKSTTRG
jgi:hypothetical protein